MRPCEYNLILPAPKRVWILGFKFNWRDLWIGAYWDPNKRILYICLLPCCAFEIQFRCATHDWVMQGGESCPIGLNQSRVHLQCAKCKTHDYGERGNPSWMTCQGCSEMKEWRRLNGSD